MKPDVHDRLWLLQHAPTPLLVHPHDRRVLIKHEGAGPFSGHKFRSFAYLAA